MLPVPCFPVGAVLCIVVSSTTHKASLLFLLVMVHNLSHPHVQPLYLVKLWQLRIRSLHIPCLRVWWEQLFIFKVGDSPHRCGIPLVSISVGTSGARPSLVGMQGLPHLQLPWQHIQCVEAHIHLLSLEEVSHSKAEGVSKTRQKAMVELILCQVLTLISYSIWVHTADHCHSLMYVQHVLLHVLILLLANFIQTPDHGVTIMDVAEHAIHESQQV